MAFDVSELLRTRHGENFALHEKHLNYQLGRVLKTIGFDRFYVRGEGSYLFDAEGDRYLDFLSGFGVYALGRSHPALKAALHQAIDLDLPNMVQMDCSLLPGILAERLVGRCGEEINRVFFCNSGAEAIESAIKFSRQATKRPRILFAEHAFHGLSTGALALNGGAEFREGFGQLLPGCDSVPFGDPEALRRELQKRDVAAFIVEPIQGKGVYMAPPEYWREVQELCRSHGTLLVLDEVQTGLGRTGKFFCFEHWDLKPDIITVSKALSGGFIPVGAVLTTDRVFSSVYSSLEKALKHSTTFGRNQLAMVAGLATLATFDEEDIVQRATQQRTRLRSGVGPPGRALRDVPRGPRQGTHDRPAVRATTGKSVAPALQHAGAPASGHLLPDDGGAPLPPPPHSHPSGGRQRQHHQAPATPHLRPGGDRLLRRRSRRRARRRAQWHRTPFRIRSHHGQGSAAQGRQGAARRRV